MNVSSLTTKAKELFHRRGGAEAAKEDAQELKDVARSDAGMSDKAKEAAEAIKDPGAPGEPGKDPGSPGEPEKTA
jgi:hypothetical protein